MSHSPNIMPHENKVELTIIKTDEANDKKNNPVKHNLKFYLPTPESAKCLSMYLKRCLAERVFTVDLMYLTPDGYRSLYNKPDTIHITPEKYGDVRTVREQKAKARLTLRVFRDEKYGGNLALVFYFYTRGDMNIMSHWLWTGLDRTWKTIECERRTPGSRRKSNGDWISCQQSGFCDRQLALAVNGLPESKRLRVLDYARSLADK